MKKYMLWFGLVCIGFKAYQTTLDYSIPNPLYTYIDYILFGLVGFYGISTIVGHLIPNSLYTYILNIFDLVWLGFIAYQSV